MAVKALLLDVGNVVLELDFSRMLERLGLAEAPNEKIAIAATDRMPLFDAYERGALDDVAFLSGLNPLLERPLSPEEFESAWNSIFLGEVDGIGETLERIARRLPLYALTNASPAHMRKALTYPCLDHFKRIFTSYEIRARKPERLAFQRALEKMAVRPEDVLFLDDRRENVEGARSFGLQAAQVAHSAEEILARLNDAGVVV